MIKTLFVTAFALTLLLTADGGLAADDGFPGIETLMTTTERQATGIDALSPQQLDALNRWIERYTGGDAAAPATVATETVRGEPARAAPPEDDFRQPREKIDFTSRIVGEFNGWSGKTRFTLDNGQVWEQRRSSRWKITLDNPEVRIYQNFMGAFEMEVLSEGRSIGVRRIQ